MATFFVGDNGGLSFFAFT